MQKRILSIFIIITLFFIGCSYKSKCIKWNGDLIYPSYTIANMLENNLNASISSDDPIIIASFVDVSDLKSTPFGRIIAEQIGSRLAQKGYKIIEMKLRQNSIFVDPKGKGEFLLSRNLQDISTEHNASAVVVGTYACSYDRVYVSARIIDPTSSVVLASYDCGIPMDYKEMHALMRNN